jgi:hypothetical protein
MSYNIFNIIGDLSVYEFFFITFLSLIRNYKLAIVLFFIIGFLLNSKLNKKLEYMFTKYLGHFGIVNPCGKFIDPSGHFQTFAFCFTFYILSHKTINPYILFLFLFIALFCLINCIVFNHHTPVEIIFGIIVGVLFSYFYFINIKPFVLPFLQNLI